MRGYVALSHAALTAHHRDDLAYACQALGHTPALRDYLLEEP
jgi:hypothetical protein